MENSRPGYEYLVAYILGKVIQDLTVEFCKRYIDKKSRTFDQMVQAARSNSQNIAEGYSNPSLKGYIKLSGIAYGSNEELTKDYQDFLRQRKLLIWEKNHPKVREFRAFRVKWISPTTLNTPTLPNNPTEAANMLLTFCNMEGFLLKKLEASLEEKHMKEGGLTEKLYRKRISYRSSPQKP
jgi:restriction system protein